MSKKIRYGYIGFGRFAEVTMLPAILKSANSELVALQKRSLDEAEQKAKSLNVSSAYGSVEDLLSDPAVDAVYIASPTCEHAKDTIAAARAGKNVLVEKPMAMNSMEAKKMIKVCKENNVKLMVAQMVRLSPVSIRIKELIGNGSVGKITYAKAEYFYDVRMSKRWWSRDMKIAGGGPTFDIGVHCLDTLRYVLDDDVVSAKGTLSPTPTQEKTEMTGTMSLKFSKGSPGNIYTSFEVPYSRIFIEIVGEDGIISAEKFTLSNLNVTLNLSKGKEGKISETITEEIVVPDIYENELTHFSNCIINNTEPMIPGEEGLKNQLVLDEVIKGLN